jgi:hypothetical protein
MAEFKRVTQYMSMSRKFRITIERRSWESTSRQRYKYSRTTVQLLRFGPVQKKEHCLVNCTCYTGFEVEMTVICQTVVSWVVTQCTLVSGYRSFGGISCLRLQDSSVKGEESGCIFSSCPLGLKDGISFNLLILSNRFLTLHPSSLEDGRGVFSRNLDNRPQDYTVS